MELEIQKVRLEKELFAKTTKEVLKFSACEVSSASKMLEMVKCSLETKYVCLAVDVVHEVTVWCGQEVSQIEHYGTKKARKWRGQ